jgi:hypothetical protein
VAPSAAPASAASRSPKLAFAGALLAYFLYFNWQHLYVDFAPDDMMNIYEYWRHGPWRLLYSQFFLWHDFYRPMGGVFYLPLFTIFGFDPLPYHAVALAFLLGASALIYRLGRLLGAGPLAAWCAAVVVAYHGGLANLYFNIAFIYDVLCLFFFLAAMVLYVAPREADRAPRAWEQIAFYACYLCALNSKEMAITLPVVLLAYEWFYHRPAIHSRHDLRLWLGGPARTTIVAGMIALVYLYGRVLGPGSISQTNGYSLHFSFDRLLTFQQGAIHALLLLQQDVGWNTVLSLWAVVTYLAWRRDRPLLRWCWVVMVVTPVPVEFLEGRGAAVLAVPLIGWALFAACVLTQAIFALSDFLGGEPVFRRIGRPLRLAVLFAYLLFVWIAQNRWARDFGWSGSMREVGGVTPHVIDEFRRLNPHMRPHSSAIFLHDPFEAWDMYFIAELWFRDKTLDFRLQSKTADPPDRFDYVFDWRDGRLVQLEHVKSQ